MTTSHRQRTSDRRALASSLAASLAFCAAIPSALADPPSAASDPWFGRDKALHCAGSALIAGGGYGASALFTDEIAGRAAFGAALAVGAGIAKEAFDAAGLGSPSARDFTWDLVGAAIGVGVSISINIAIGG